MITPYHLPIVCSTSLPPLPSLQPPFYLSPTLSSEPTGQVAGTPKRILVIDDDPAILLTVRGILEFEGYEVETARDGAEGLARLQHTLPSLILLDMRMPVMDGWRFAERLHAARIQIPLIVITAAQTAAQWAEEVGAVAHLDKPFDLVELLDLVEQHCA